MYSAAGVLSRSEMEYALTKALEGLAPAGTTEPESTDEGQSASREERQTSPPDKKAEGEEKKAEGDEAKPEEKKEPEKPPEKKDQ